MIERCRHCPHDHHSLIHCPTKLCPCPGFEDIEPADMTRQELVRLIGMMIAEYHHTWHGEGT